MMLNVPFLACLPNMIIHIPIHKPLGSSLKFTSPLINEFGITKDVCASQTNHKLPDYWNKEDNALTKDWIGNCWMNPPFDRNLANWVRKASDEADKNGGTKVCLIPVRSNTKWWAVFNTITRK